MLSELDTLLNILHEDWQQDEKSHHTFLNVLVHKIGADAKSEVTTSRLPALAGGASLSYRDVIHGVSDSTKL